ncbi:MAG: hypothetical protein V4550_18645 [Gemmatimonadota bacterium]
MKRISVLLALVTLASAAAAQEPRANGIDGRAPLATDSVARSVAEAELEGARYPRAAELNPRRPWDANAQGTSERKCLEADKLRAARSGDFYVGDFAGRTGWPSYSEMWRTGYGKLIWQPVHLPSPGVVVRATRLDVGAESRVYGPFPISHPGESMSTTFHPSGVHVPTTGRWMLVATSGSNWGCFVITVT